MSEETQVKAGCVVGPGTYTCTSCGHEHVLESEKDLKACPSCACDMYNCIPMTHVRPDIKTAEDVMNPPERK